MKLESRWVRLEPLQLSHVDALVRAASDRSTFSLAPVPRDREEMVAYVETAQADVAFAVVRDDEVVGSLRFMNREWWSWPPGPISVAGEPRRREADPPDAVEVGHAWLHPSAQRTHVLTASCLLLFAHAFEVWRVHRLVLKTDARNQRSRAAIERLGGRFEGILRAHLPAADGGIRDTALFSMLPSEWPAARKRLESTLPSVE